MTGSDVESRSTEHAKPWRAAFEDVAVRVASCIPTMKRGRSSRLQRAWGAARPSGSMHDSPCVHLLVANFALANTRDLRTCVAVRWTIVRSSLTDATWCNPAETKPGHAALRFDRHAQPELRNISQACRA
ncbi:uncharacterized protein PSANT_06652 [Moesziomyces antarcticus]|uniref:Uncharacterized protein n=1 Tax=Pseudozyma antarctica TaxID=84753 RepID=A0A5C3FYX0_PSEA2|nr:uncharacterized protein PSANT_06652 [Moesziomyces antarcticus]